MLLPRQVYLEHQANHHQPFVSYRLPHTKEVVVLHTSIENCQLFSQFEEIQHSEGFLFSPFVASEETPSVFIKPLDVLVNNEGFRSDMLCQEKGLLKSQGIPVATSFESYSKQFDKFKQALQQKEVEKIILSRIWVENKLDANRVFWIYEDLLEQYPNAFVFWVHLPHLGINWMGASPETLLHIGEKETTTTALAGTKLPEADWTAKEYREQQLVETFIAAQLKKLGIEAFDHTPVQTVFAGKLQHLLSSFHIPNEQIHSRLGQFLELLHPTPAVCGVPQPQALQLIQAVEKHSRAYYCGYLGPLNLMKQSHFFVNLRSMQLVNNTPILYTGGGLTLESVKEDEWVETTTKAQTLQVILNNQ